MKKELLQNNPCLEDCDQMKGTSDEKLCEKCMTTLPNLSNKSIESIVKNYFGKKKCVILSNHQLELFLKMKQLKKITIASSLFIGTTFMFSAYGQTHVQHADSCLIKGIAIDEDREILKERAIYVYLKDDDTIYETRTNENGEFQLNLPLNCEIDYSNIKQLKNKKIRNRKQIHLRKAKTITVSRAPGFF
ncbi:hypothetical protein SAMN05216480_10429 [Pustulibacterium marinum]|uniref:Uncharacterized protein n=1 Tax=Pustulibacterium marinum TaxID=1224947 RepID=A0A1I7GAF1_9FLAO|nr:hypothetical protein [Pustulibacterium marinum]SFU45409.1 hypothetical protein SAMN05216480_10429 [Pustulibacterium marinum]